MIRPSLHPCFHGIPMPMCLLCTLLRIQHACALEYDKPWQIQHYIHIFNMLVLSGSSVMLYTSIFYDILETNMVFFADSKFVNFNKNTYIFLFFSYLSSVITPQLKTHTVSVLSISLSFLNHLKKILYGALKNTNLYMLEKTHFRIVALRHSNAAPTIDIPFSRFDLLDN